MKTKKQKEYDSIYFNYECDYAAEGDRAAIKEMISKYGIEKCKKIERRNAYFRLQEVIRNPFEFEYQMLSRLKMDCNYYLGNGARNEKHLWALDAKEQIKKMKELWNTVKDKPEWLTFNQILSYEKQMCL